MEFLTTITIAIFLILGIIIGYYLGNKIATIKRDRHWEINEIPNHRKDAKTMVFKTTSERFD